MPGGSGIELIRHAAKTCPACEVMVISVFGDEQHVVASIEAGATGYLLRTAWRSTCPSNCARCARAAAPSARHRARRLLQRLTPPVQSAPQPPYALAGTAPRGPDPDEEVVALSEQESRVLHLAAKGFTFDEIAQFMQVSPHTVMTYVKRVYRKLHVRSKVEAIYEAPPTRLATGLEAGVIAAAPERGTLLGHERRLTSQPRPAPRLKPGERKLQILQAVAAMLEQPGGEQSPRYSLPPSWI